MTEIWAFGYNARAADIAPRARAYEAAGFDGYLITDSQNLWMECWVALTVVAQVTERMGVGVYVTNPITRHPAVTASAAATLQELSDGRVLLGVGRGDSALANIGFGLVPLAGFEVYLVRLQGYLRGEDVPFDHRADPFDVPHIDALGYGKAAPASKIRWLPTERPKVPVDIAASGPRVIELAARHADGVTLAVGADVERLQDGIRAARQAREDAGLDPASLAVSALVPVAVNPDLEVAQGMAAGGVASIGRWLVQQRSAGTMRLDDQTRDELLAATASYDMTRHGETATTQATVLTPAVVDRFAVVGPPDRCVERLRPLLDLGLSKIILSPQARGAEPALEETHRRLLLDEVLPRLRGA